MGIAEAVAAMGAGPLTEEGLQRHVRPLFSRSLAGGGIYLATHSLGRPLDAVFANLEEGARLWAEQMREARTAWTAEENAYRAALARLLGTPRTDLVVPKVSAGHGLRAVLNTLPAGATVVTTKGEFSTVAVVLAHYQALGRIRVVRAETERDGRWKAACVAKAMRLAAEVHLVVVSHVFYTDGQLFHGLPALAAECQVRGATLLVDAYHSLGAVPFTQDELGCDYLIGGCYKYLRGGEGIAFLALSPGAAKRVRPVDMGWLAEEPGTDPWAPGGPRLRAGGDAWLEGTPAMMTYYQARSGLAFTEAVGVDRLRAYGLQQLVFLRESLQARGIESLGGDAEHGAFLTVALPHAAELVKRLLAEGIECDERAGRLRLCPELLTTREQLLQVADAVARLSR